MVDGQYAYFTKEELDCSHCGMSGMDDQFMQMVIELRRRCGFQFIVTSAYRCPEHPVEASKKAPGAHTTGKSMDIKVSGKRAWTLLKEASEMGFIGIGVNQKGDHNQRFIHLDMWTEGPRPGVWSY